MKLYEKLAKSIYLLIPVFTLLGACGRETAEEQANATAEEYFAQSCGACHTVADNAPTVAEMRALSSEDLRDGIINHPTAGEITERLSAARIDELIKYIETP